jgi:hypothetical protein
MLMHSERVTGDFGQVQPARGYTMSTNQNNIFTNGGSFAPV